MYSLLQTLNVIIISYRTIAELRPWLEQHSTHAIDLTDMDMSEPYNYEDSEGGDKKDDSSKKSVDEDDDDDCGSCVL